MAFAGRKNGPWLTDAAVLPLILIPLSFGYSVVRYRLMDVELVVRRVFVYVLTTLAIALMVGAVVYLAGLYAFGGDPGFSSGELTLRVVLAIVAMAAIVMIAAPVKNFLQEQIDRLFYGERYDMRHSLLDFGRTLSATTALDPLLDSLVSRLQQVMNVGRVAIFIEDKHAAPGYRVARAAGLSAEMVVPPDFREMIRIRSAETGVVRTDDMDLVPETTGFVRRSLHYYVPCVVRGRMVAVIGLGRSADGALLSSEDVDILLTVSGYVAVAIENSLLYQEQQERAGELKLLKEFNESIIESINVGLLAVDLEGRVTRLNSALEEILDLSRAQAVGKRVEDLFRKTLPIRCDKCLATIAGASGKFAISTRSTPPLSPATHWCSTSPSRRCRIRWNRPARWLSSRTSLRACASKSSCSSAKTFFDWIAGRRRGPRSEHAAHRRLFIYADAARDARRNRSETCAPAQSTPAG